MALCRLAAVQTPLHVYWDLGAVRFFVVRFVAKRRIVEQKCQKGQIGTLMLGTRWYKF